MGAPGFDVIVEAGLAQSDDHSFNSALRAAVGGAHFLLQVRLWKRQALIASAGPDLGQEVMVTDFVEHQLGRVGL